MSSNNDIKHDERSDKDDDFESQEITYCPFMAGACPMMMNEYDYDDSDWDNGNDDSDEYRHHRRRHHRRPYCPWFCHKHYNNRPWW